MAPFASGYYRPSGIAAVQCPAGNSCTVNSATVCASPTYSLIGIGYCSHVPYGYYSSSGIKTACASGKVYDKSTSTCTVACSGMKCDLNSALT